MQLLATAKFLGSFSLRARAPGAVDHAAEPCALVPRRRVGAEVVEARHEPHRPWLVEGEVERGTAWCRFELLDFLGGGLCVVRVVLPVDGFGGATSSQV